jgi:hypothetical protein
MEDVVLDQAGLDLLLAHPHIVNVALLAIAATESRVDSPCSWRALNLAWGIDIRTVAYVPLHSLEQPLDVWSLLLPPDVPSDQLPQLLLKATSRIVEHPHLFSRLDAGFLLLYDYVSVLASGGSVMWRVDVQPAFSPATQSALLAALDPLASTSKIEELDFCFNYEPSAAGPPPRLRISKSTLESLYRTWGSRIRHLRFEGVTLAPGFFLALETCFPQLKDLELRSVETDAQGLAPRIMLFCQRMTRPMRLSLDQEVYM